MGVTSTISGEGPYIETAGGEFVSGSRASWRGNRGKGGHRAIAGKYFLSTRPPAHFRIASMLRLRLRSKR